MGLKILGLKTSLLKKKKKKKYFFNIKDKSSKIREKQ